MFRLDRFFLSPDGAQGGAATTADTTAADSKATGSGTATNAAAEAIAKELDGMDEGFVSEFTSALLTKEGEEPVKVKPKAKPAAKPATKAEEASDDDDDQADDDPEDEKEPEEEPDEDEDAEEEEEEPKEKPKAKHKPVELPPHLIRMAYNAGIAPHELSEFRSKRELENELVRRHYEAQAERQRRGEDEEGEEDDQETPEDKKTAKPAAAKKGGPLNLTFDPDLDEPLVGNFKTVQEHINQRDSVYEKRISQLEKATQYAIAELKAAADARAEAEVTQYGHQFDVLVEKAGDVAKALFGKPSEMTGKPGTKEHKNLTKIADYMTERIVGARQLGRKVDVEQLFNEGLRAVFGKHVTEQTREEITHAMNGRRGSSALRPSPRKNRSTEYGTGDDAAERAISDQMIALGIS